jgi:hypothetical protein
MTTDKILNNTMFLLAIIDYIVCCYPHPFKRIPGQYTSNFLKMSKKSIYQDGESNKTR